MRQFRWNEDKNRQLKANANRGVCFEDVVAAIEGGNLLDDVEHLNVAKYPNQRMFVVRINDYVFGVPYVASSTDFFLKTVYPSRKLTLKYLGEDHDQETDR